MHHVDVHVRDLAATRQLFDAVFPTLGWERRSSDDDFLSYWQHSRRPVLGFIRDEGAGSAAMRIAFGAKTRNAIDAAAHAAAANGARNIEGPGIHPEYGDDYYAVFFEDAAGNKFEVCLEQ